MDRTLQTAWEAAEYCIQHRPQDLARIWSDIGGWLYQRMDFDASKRAFQVAMVLAWQNDKPSLARLSKLWMAAIARARGDLQRAGALMDETRQAFMALPPWQGRMEWEAEAGELARARGDWEEAERWYAASYKGSCVFRPAEALSTLLNLALVARAMGNLTLARNRAERARADARPGGMRWVTGSAEVILAACAADEGRFDEAEVLLQDGAGRLRRFGFRAPEIADLAREIEEKSRNAGKPSAVARAVASWHSEGG